jgi:hypothetical protein
MPTVFVSHNIERIQGAIKDFREEISRLNERKKELTTEITRLEGCLLTFRGFNEAGIEGIVPEHEKNFNVCNQESVKEEHNANPDPRAHTKEQEEHNANPDPRAHTKEQEEHNVNPDPRAHTHEKEHGKTPLEELYAKYRTM